MDTKITNLEQLKNLFTGDTEDETGEFYIQLSIGRSWKQISYHKESFFIFNEIDESEQELNSKQLFDKNVTMIGDAINKGNFYFAWF